MNHRIALILACCVLFGCNRSEDTLPQKPARPVTTITLTKSVPVSTNIVSGSVKSWKTEDIGFEVTGRLLWVLEPGENVDGRMYPPIDKPSSKKMEATPAQNDPTQIDPAQATAISFEEWKPSQKGTPLAQIDPTRYQIALESAEANLEVAKLKKKSIEIRLADSLPAEIASARSDLKLATSDFERIEGLYKQNAVSLAEFDQAQNLKQRQDAALKSLLASQKQSEAESLSADSEIKRAVQAVKDAKRDLENTTLYGAYNGQISKVMVVPGSVVTAGSPVLTLQMTNPIKADIELSAEQSRRLRNQRNLPVSFTLPDGSIRRENAFVYNIDPSADPTTRTFTMTMLIINEPFRDQLEPAAGDPTIARTDDVWPIMLNKLLNLDGSQPMVEEESILRDEQGSYIYVVTNVKLREMFSGPLQVTKQRLIENDLRVSFLGNWVFRSVSFVEPIVVEETSLYVGKLGTDGDPNQWSGNEVVIDSGPQWMLRPGDLINVDISGSANPPGFFLPIQAIYKEGESDYIFVAEDDKSRKIKVKRLPAENLDTASMIQIESPELTGGMKVIVGGVHSLTDGQSIRAIAAPSKEEK